MKTQFNNRAMIVITACSLGLLSVFASAGQDESQRYLTQQVIKTKQQVQAAGATMVAACKQMMGPSRSMMGPSQGSNS